MIRLLSIDNSNDWSWGIVLSDLLNRIPEFDVTRYSRIPEQQIPVDMVDGADVVMLQNVDHLKLVGKLDKKVVVRIGGMYINEDNPASRFDEQLSKCGAVIATNNELGELASKVNDNTVVIPNGIDPRKFYPRETKREPGVFRVGFSGNILGIGSQYKGFPIFAEAMTRMYGEVESVKLFYMDNQIPHDRMTEEFYHKIDCLVSLSIAEGCSNTLAEALACGVPVISTKVGYHGENLKHGINCLFVERNVFQVVNAIRFIKSNKLMLKQLSLEGRRFAMAHHDLGKVADKYRTVINSVLNRR